jgi:hypothetical protein
MELDLTKPIAGGIVFIKPRGQESRDEAFDRFESIADEWEDVRDEDSIVVIVCGWLEASDYERFVKFAEKHPRAGLAWVDFKRPDGTEYFSAWIGDNTQHVHAAVRIIASMEGQDETSEAIVELDTARTIH